MDWKGDVERVWCLDGVVELKRRRTYFSVSPLEGLLNECKPSVNALRAYYISIVTSFKSPKTRTGSCFMLRCRRIKDKGNQREIKKGIRN